MNREPNPETVSQVAPGLQLQELYDQHNRLVRELRRDYNELGEIMTSQNKPDRYGEWEDGRVMRRQREPYPAHWKAYQEVNRRIRRKKAELAECADRIMNQTSNRRPKRNIKQYIIY